MKDLTLVKLYLNEDFVTDGYIIEGENWNGFARPYLAHSQMLKFKEYADKEMIDSYAFKQSDNGNWLFKDLMYEGEDWQEVPIFNSPDFGALYMVSFSLVWMVSNNETLKEL